MTFAATRTFRSGTRLAVIAAAALLLSLAPGAGEAAILKNVTSGSVTLPNNTTPTQVALTNVDITKAFVLCSSRAFDSTASNMLYMCDLNTGGGPRLTITPTTAPGGVTSAVQYHVAEFAAGVSVQRGTTTFTGTNLTPSSAPVLTTVDCTKSFVLTSVRTTQGTATADERWTVRATLGTFASPCSTTTNNLELTRLEGSAGTTLTVAWQVVTYEGASVQRGTTCIGSSGACGLIPSGVGLTQGLNNQATLASGVDTSKSFLLFTSQAGTGVAGVDGEHMVRGEFRATGASVTTLLFQRGFATTTANHQVQISYEVVTLNDGSTVQSSGATPTTMAAATASTSPNFGTIVDATRTVGFGSFTGGGSGANTVYNDVVATFAIRGSNGGGGSDILITRVDSTIAATYSWFAVSFFRCNTASGVAHDTLCTVGFSTTGTEATINWTSRDTVMILAGTSGGTAPITFNPANGTTYAQGTTQGGSFVAYSGSTASDTIFTQSTGLSAGNTYYFKVWAKVATATGGCNTPPCYFTGVQGTVTPRVGNTAWSGGVLGGAALNPAIAGTGRMSLGSNANKIVNFNSTNGRWAGTGVPLSTSAAVQGPTPVFPFGAGEAVIGGDQSGFVYSMNPNDGTINWLVKMNADAIQAPATVYQRAFFSTNMTGAYPGTYDLVFVATMNTTPAGFINNKVFALRSDTGAVLWTFSPATLAVAPCPTGCNMDQVVSQPYLDYFRDKLYVASHWGNTGTQNSLWVLDVVNNGALLNVFGGGDFTTAPSQSIDLDTLYIGDEAGTLHILNLNTLVMTTNLAASGTAFKGFVWEDFTTFGRLYFVTTDGNVWCLVPPSATPCWKVKPVPSGTVNQILLGEPILWVGGAAPSGNIYQLDLADGATLKTFAVGPGNLAVGPITTETGDELYAPTSDGLIYKINLNSGSLP